MAVTGAVILEALRAVGAGSGLARPADELASGANSALRNAPGLTGLGAASFLATQAQESAYFRVTEEYAKNGRYAPHIGRTFEMVTWDTNYLAFGQWCKANGHIKNSERQFVDDPPWLADYRWAWLGGVWYFEANNLWPIANSGDHFKVSQIVNGGLGMVRDGRTPNGWGERKQMFDVFARYGSSLLPDGVAPGPVTAPTTALPTIKLGDKGENVRRLQDWSNWYAWRPAVTVVAEDGDYGPATRNAVAQMQQRMGITGSDADGTIVGPRTNAGLAQRGYPNK